MSTEKLTTEVMAIMGKNRRETAGFHYTVPSPELYPFQWLWDSCFHALILLKCGQIEQAHQEIYSALARPLENGLLPHINYWRQPPTGEPWGREHRGDVITEAWSIEGSSSITQPPIIANTVLRLYEAHPSQDFLEATYPVLCNHFEYLWQDRRFNGDSLLYIINPDESGEDNSPRFDQAVDLPAKHSANEHLDRRIELMRQNAACGFRANKCMSLHFGIADTPFNILFREGLESLAKLAQVMGDAATHESSLERAEQVEHDLRTFLKKDELFLSYDFVSKSHIEVKTWAIFMPLYGGLLNDAEAKSLVDNYLLNQELFYTPFSVPSTAKDEPAYDSNDGFWRGPVWFAPNWFIYHGLKRYGFNDVAEEIKQKSLLLLEHSGFREQYHPDTGEGQGAHDFTWGGLVLDMC